nr:uncharacterized protein LOC127487771 [Oryctolagus cuniculus]
MPALEGKEGSRAWPWRVASTMPERRRSSPKVGHTPPQLPPPGRQEATTGAPPRPIARGVCGIGKKRPLEHPRPGPAQAALVTNLVLYSPWALALSQALEAHGYATNGEQDRTTPRPLDTPGTHHPTGAGWQARRHAPAKPIPHPRGDGTTPAASLQRSEAPTGLPFSYRLDPPKTPKGHVQQRHPGEGAGGTGATPPLGFRHLRHNLDHSRGTAQARAEAGRRRAMPRHVTGLRPPAIATRQKAGVRRSGRFPQPCRPHTTHRWGKQNEGPAGQEKLGNLGHERPSLIWRGLSPAQESATAPHRSFRHISRKLELKWSRQDSNWHSHMEKGTFSFTYKSNPRRKMAQ